VSDLVQIGRASSAAKTEFVATQVEGPGGALWIDGNQKVTRDNGSYAAPRPNAFSLLAGNGDRGDEPGHEREHCPGSTATCRASCYVHGIVKHAGSTYDLYRQNSEMIRRIMRQGAHAWASLLGDWISENAPGGFRWHVSGDVYSSEYAHWIAEVCRASGDVQHWIYTRSFRYVRPLAEVATFRGGNLALNLSADVDNYDDAFATWQLLMSSGGAAPRICYLTRDGKVPDDLPHGSVTFPDYPLRWADGAPRPAWLDELTPFQRRGVCPTDLRGKSEQRRCGPCDLCLS
jgi:hypothetical protein